MIIAIQSSPYKFIQVNSRMKTGSNSEDYYLEVCKCRVEEKLGWGSSNTWSHNDFLEASERISEDSGITLSVTTIKRLWGKVKYDGSPNTGTLNALAIYLGYQNWRSFKLSQDELRERAPMIEESVRENTVLLQEDVQTRIQVNKPVIKQGKRNKFYVSLLSSAALIAAMFYFFFMKAKENERIEAQNIVFHSEPVTTGLPNTVVFNYDLTPFEFDSAFIQQNWDPRRRQRIKPENNQMTSVYYYPGHFQAKLVINDKVVKEHGVLIPTEGWLGFIDVSKDLPPVYIYPQQLYGRGTLHTSMQVLADKKGVALNDFNLTYCNARDYGVDGDNFTLETAIKNNLDEGGLTCQESYIYLDGETGIIGFPLSALGCVGNIGLDASEVHISGKDKDLSVFGADLSCWNKLKCEVTNKKVALFVNQKLVYSLSYKKPMGKIMGINFSFQGTGAVDYVRLSDGKNKVVYEDDFDVEEKHLSLTSSSNKN